MNFNKKIINKCIYTMEKIYNVCKSMCKYRKWKYEEDISKWDKIIDVYDEYGNLVKIIFIDNQKITMNILKNIFIILNINI